MFVFIVFVSVCQSVCLSVYHYTVRTAWVANKLHHIQKQSLA